MLLLLLLLQWRDNQRGKRRGSLLLRLQLGEWL
jgi:hypothetical protein